MYTAKNGMVASSDELASNSGRDILKKGGNAVDASIATAFTLSVVLQGSCGVAGEAMMSIYLERGRETVFIDACGTVPLEAKQDMFIVDSGKGLTPFTQHQKVVNSENMIGPKAATVPGQVAGLYEAHEKFGCLEWETLLEPAIKIAEKGFEVKRYQAEMIKSFLETKQMQPDIEKIYLKKGNPSTYFRKGNPPKHLAFYPDYRGDTVIQNYLSKTLKNISKNGPDDFYNGEIAQKITNEMEKRGGLINEKDLTTYKPKILKHKPVTYRNHEIFPSFQGGMCVVQTFNMMETVDIKKQKHNSSKNIDIISRSLQTAFKDGFDYVGDPYSFRANEVISKQHVSSFIRENKETMFKTDHPSTTHLSVIDKDRNMVSLTLTLGAGPSIVIPQTGMFMNGMMLMLNPNPGYPDSISPGKRSLIPMSPMLCFENGEPKFVVGSSGGRRIVSGVVQIMSNIIDHGMGIQQAHEAPRIHSEPWITELIMDDRIPEGVQNEVMNYGYKIQAVEESIDSFHFSNPNGILIQSERETLEGGVSPLHLGSGRRGYYKIFPNISYY